MLKSYPEFAKINTFKVSKQIIYRYLRWECMRVPNYYHFHQLIYYYTAFIRVRLKRHNETDNYCRIERDINSVNYLEFILLPCIKYNCLRCQLGRIVRVIAVLCVCVCVCVYVCVCVCVCVCVFRFKNSRPRTLHWTLNVP